MPFSVFLSFSLFVSLLSRGDFVVCVGPREKDRERERERERERVRVRVRARGGGL